MTTPYDAALRAAREYQRTGRRDALERARRLLHEATQAESALPPSGRPRSRADKARLVRVD